MTIVTKTQSFSHFDIIHIQRVSLDIYNRCIQKEATFEDLQRFLLNPESRDVYQRYFEDDHRIALTAFALAFFEIEPSLAQISGEFLECLMTYEYTNVDMARERLDCTWEQYRVLFIAWKGQDRQEMLATLSQMYWEYEINYRIYKDRLSVEEQRYYLEEKEKRQAECLAMMRRMDNLAYFHQFTPVFVDSHTSELLIQVLRRAFWDRILANVMMNPPQLDDLYALFREIREHLQTLIGARHPGWLEDYDDYFDIDFLKQRTETSSILTLEFWKPRCEKLAELLIALDSSARQPQHEAMIARFHTDIIPDAVSTDDATHSILPFMHFIEYFMTRLLEIVHIHQAVFSPMDEE